MKETKESILMDLKLLIDISCLESEEPTLFELFHEMLVRMSYRATNVSIDYARKRVYMNVLAEDESYDAELVNEFAETMSVNIGYTDLNTFLKSCILEDLEGLNQYYPYLVSRFFRRNASTINTFETA